MSLYPQINDASSLWTQLSLDCYFFFVHFLFSLSSSILVNSIRLSNLQGMI